MTEPIKTEDALTRIRKSRDYLQSDDNKSEVDDLEKRFEKLKTDKAFLDLDYIKDIKKRIKSILVDIKVKLAEEDDTDKRRVMKSDRDSYTWLLKFFSRDVEKELGEVNAKANEML